MRITRTTMCLATMVALGLTTATNAALIDSFDYAPGALGNQGGWSARDAGGIDAASNATVVSESLTFGNIITDGGKLQLSTMETALIPTTINWDADNTTYISFLVNAVGAEGSGSGRFLNMGFSSEVVEGRGWTGLFQQGHVGVDNLSGSAFSDPGVYPPATTFFILAEVATKSTGDDAITLRAYGTPDGQGGILNATPAAEVTVISNGDRTGTTTHLEFRLGSNMTLGYIDEIRVGSTIAEVAPIPEPASLALMGLGGLLVLRRRRAG